MMILKRFAIILLFFHLSLLLGSDSLAIEPMPTPVSFHWSLDQARKEALKELPVPLDMRIFPSQDPHFEEHNLARESGQNRYQQEQLTFFNNGNYGVVETGSSVAFYYDKEGNLKSVSLNQGTGYPNKSYKYAFPSGRLLVISIRLSSSESYVFKANGDLVAHWVGDHAFGPHGRLSVTRKPE